MGWFSGIGDVVKLLKTFGKVAEADVSDIRVDRKRRLISMEFEQDINQEQVRQYVDDGSTDFGIDNRRVTVRQMKRPGRS